MKAAAKGSTRSRWDMLTTGALLKQAGLVVPRNGVANLVFFQVRGDCLAPDVQDGDVLFAAWRPTPVGQARLARDELAVFLVQDAGTGQARALLKRWRGLLGGDKGSDKAIVRLASERGVRSFPASQVQLLADHVRLAHRDGSGTLQRGGQYNADLLAGAVHAGDDDLDKTTS